MDQKVRNHPESIFNIILMILGFVIIIFSLKLGFGTLRKPGIGLVPFLAGLSIAISSLLLIVFKKRRSIGESLFNKHEIKIYSLMTAVFILWIVVMPILGWFLVTFASTFAFSKIMELKGWLKPFILSIGTALLAYLLFDYFLYLDLPRGILG
jgi:putative tricarboxylic transport membrane protein